MGEPQLIYFGGPGALTGGAADSGAAEQDTELFLHYIGTVWVHEHPLPDTRQALARLDWQDAAPDYERFLQAGGRVPERGLTLEELWLLSQVIFGEPFRCLVSSVQPPQPLERVTRKELLPPGQITARLKEYFFGRFSLRKSTHRQILGVRALRRICVATTYDGRTGHCITVFGIADDEETLIYHDPWPGRSLLCRENNVAGVEARPERNGEPFWLVRLEEFERVVYGVLILQDPVKIVPIP